MDAKWCAYIAARRESELEAIIQEQWLKPEAARAFMDSAFRDGELHTAGTAVTKLLPPVSRFAAQGVRNDTKRRVIDVLSRYFERFFGLSARR